MTLPVSRSVRGSVRCIRQHPSPFCRTKVRLYSDFGGGSMERCKHTSRVVVWGRTRLYIARRSSIGRRNRAGGYGDAAFQFCIVSSGTARLQTCRRGRRRGLRFGERHISRTLTPSAYPPPLDTDWSPQSRLAPLGAIYQLYGYVVTMTPDCPFNHQQCQWPLETARRSLPSFALCPHNMSMRFLSIAPKEGSYLSELRVTRRCRSNIATRRLTDTLHSTLAAGTQ